MKVRRLKLHHFTVFEDAEIDFSPGVNVLIGANGTGKTHVLKLVYSILRSFGELSAVRSPPEPVIADFAGRLQAKLVNVFRPFENRAGRLVRKSRGRDKAAVSLNLDDGSEISFQLSSLDRMGLEGERVPLTPSCIYIPSREVLSFYHGFAYAYQNRELDFDETYFDLCIALSGTPLRGPREAAVTELIAPLHKAVLRDVTLSNGYFFLTAPGEGAVEAHLAAEGLRKIATLMHLIKNGALAQNSVLIWDEPEANLNPRLVTAVTTLLRLLAAAGVQLFLASHDYLLTNELSLQAEYNTAAGRDAMARFFCLNRSKPSAPVEVVAGNTLAELPSNPILEEFAAFYDRERKLYEEEPAKGESS